MNDSIQAQSAENDAPEYVSPEMRRRLAAAWFAGYDKGNLDGYFGTRDERKSSPYADLDPYAESSRCSAEGPREATSGCVRATHHGGEHRDDTGGTWLFSPGADQ